MDSNPDFGEVRNRPRDRLLLSRKVLFFYSVVISAFVAAGVNFDIISLEGVSILVSASLSLLLVVLYSQQNELQRKQGSILEAQQKVMKSENEPIIDFDSVNIFEWDESKTEHLEIGIKNVGNGVALDPALYSRLSFDHEELTPVGAYSSLTRVDTSESDSPPSLSTAMPADSRVRVYAGGIQVQWVEDMRSDNPEKNSDMLEFGIERLHSRGVDKMELELGVAIKNQYGERTHSELLRLDIEVEPVALASFGGEEFEEISDPLRQFNLERILRYNYKERVSAIFDNMDDGHLTSHKTRAADEAWTNKFDEMLSEEIQDPRSANN